MGLFDSCYGNHEYFEAKKLSKKIEKRIRKDRTDYRREYKLLLLGTGESGKSTFIKQLRIIHGKGYSDQERKQFIRPILQNINTSLRCIIEAMETYNIESSNPDFQRNANIIKAEIYPKEPLSDKIIGAIHFLGDDDGVLKAIRVGNKYNLLDSTEYYLSPENRTRILNQNYIPTLDDILRQRTPTYGILEFYFKINFVNFRIVDVGGQRSERRKWIHCFDNVTSIIYLVATSEYDQNLTEAPDGNRMSESVALFRTIVSYQMFEEISIILFLNKVDLFDKKLKISPLSQYLTDYKGDNLDSFAAKDFIVSKFLSQNPYKYKSIYSHFTCATDTENIKFVFDAVKDTILQSNLKQYNLL